MTSTTVSHRGELDGGGHSADDGGSCTLSYAAPCYISFTRLLVHFISRTPI